MRNSVLFMLTITVLPLLVVGNVEASEDAWVGKASLPWPEPVYGTAVVNGKIYVFGSCSQIGSHLFWYPKYVANGTVYPLEYDPVADKWTKKAPMPSLRIHFAVTTYQNQIYVIGGQNPHRTDIRLNMTEVYDPETDTWTTRSSMPMKQSRMGAHVIGDKIYVTSGSLFYLNLTSDTLVYDPASDSWSFAARMPNPVFAYVSAVVNNRIYVIGGMNQFFLNENTTQVYDPATDSWAVGASLPEPISQAGVQQPPASWHL
jgi:N-acetylneuraminic acid mutarotase